MTATMPVPGQTSRATGTIVVTGASGTIGRALIDVLLENPDVTIRAAMRQPRPPRAGVSTARVVPVAFDWEAPSGADDVVRNADTLFVLPPPALHPLPTSAHLIHAAAAAGIRHVVFLSTLGADFDPGFAFGRWALEGEQALAEAGLPYTVLRPNSFMSNFLTAMRPAADGAVRLPWGTGKTSFIDPRDVGAVAAEVLLAPDDHAGKTYELTGPEALDATEVAAALRAASGAPIHYADLPLDTVGEALSSAGVAPPMVTALIELHAVMASGARAVLTDSVQHITGRPPRSLAQFAADHAFAWACPPQGRAV